MDLQKINELIQKYAEGTATETEQNELLEWYRNKAWQDAQMEGDEEEIYKELFYRINNATSLNDHGKKWKTWAVAASML